jgi:hypothetical protein
MNERFPDDGVAHRCEIASRGILEIKLHCLTQIGDRFIARRAKARDINIQTLGDEILLFAVNAVSDRFHALTLSLCASHSNEATLTGPSELR